MVPRTLARCYFCEINMQSLSGAWAEWAENRLSGSGAGAERGAGVTKIGERWAANRPLTLRSHALVVTVSQTAQPQRTINRLITPLIVNSHWGDNAVVYQHWYSIITVLRMLHLLNHLCACNYSFQNLQRMWSQSTNVTDVRTDGQLLLLCTFFIAHNVFNRCGLSADLLKHMMMMMMTDS